MFYPSHTTSRSTTSLASSPPKILLSAQVSSIVPYFEILSVGNKPSEPMLLTVPFGPISWTWSRAAYSNLSFHLKGVMPFYFLKNSMASEYAFLPSLVSINDRPSSEYKVVPLNLPKHLSKWAMNDFGF